MDLTTKLKPLFYTLIINLSMLSGERALGQQATNNELSPASFKVEGFNNEEILMKLFVGNFSEIEFKGNDEIKTYLIFKSFVESYSTYCEEYLPANKVPLTKEICVQKREYVTRNGWGIVTSRSTRCVQWKTVETGIYAAPKLYNVLVQLESSLKDDYLRLMVGGLTRQSNPFGSAMKTLDLVKWGESVERDMNSLIRAHSCASPVIQHFEKNLLLYALDKSPVRIAYNEKLFAKPKPPAPDSQNYSKLIDALVMEDARGWMINRYITGSVSDVRVAFTDREGNPAKIEANYIFKGFGGKQYKGSVTLTFEEGLPDCLFFFDFPQRCKTANKRVVNAYVQGEYQK